MLCCRKAEIHRVAAKELTADIPMAHSSCAAEKWQQLWTWPRPKSGGLPGAKGTMVQGSVLPSRAPYASKRFCVGCASNSGRMIVDGDRPSIALHMEGLSSDCCQLLGRQCSSRCTGLSCAEGGHVEHQNAWPAMPASQIETQHVDGTELCIRTTGDHLVAT